MKGQWPKVTCSVERIITAWHTLPEINREPRHSHEYIIRAGWTHEINPNTIGCTKPMGDMEKDLIDVTQPLVDGELNDILPFAPTAEIMACWIMARLPGYWSFVEIECYGSFKCRVTADSMRSEWTTKFQ